MRWTLSVGGCDRRALLRLHLLLSRALFLCVFLCVLAVCLAAAVARAAVVLQYHHIATDTPAATSSTPAQFRQHLAYLAEQGFRVVPLPELVEALRRGQSLADKTVAISFDDGYQSVYTEAFPLLRQRNWPFTVFVSSEAIDKRTGPVMSWAQLREMAAAGATIANHGLVHRHLQRRLLIGAVGESESVWRRRTKAEILAAEARINVEIGSAPRLLAYPYGEFDRPLMALLAQLGFAGLGQHSGPLSATDSLQALPRFPLGGDYGGLADFADKVNSLPLTVVSVELLDEQGGPLADGLLSPGSRRPQLRLRLPAVQADLAWRCFASGQGQADVQQLEEEGQGTIGRKMKLVELRVQASKPLAPGRSRYNCTASSAEAGRFYWWSQPWILPRADGSWQPEP